MSKFSLLRAIQFAQLALGFGRVNRATFHEDGKRPETDTDHTVMLGLIACDLAKSLNDNRNYTVHSIPLDVGLVAQFALVHDLVEVYAGDTQSLGITDTARASKEQREHLAFLRLKAEFDENSWLCQSITLYEEQATQEARFIKVMDKILPKLTHLSNNCIAAKQIMNAEEFRNAHTKQFVDLKKKYSDVHSEVFRLLQEAMEEAEQAFTRT